MAHESAEAKITSYYESALKNRQLTRVVLLNGDSNEIPGYILILSGRTRHCHVIPLELLSENAFTVLEPCGDIEAVDISLASPGRDVTKGQEGDWLESFGLDLRLLLPRDVDTQLLEAFLETAIGKLPDWYEESGWKDAAVRRYVVMMIEPIIHTARERTLVERTLVEVLDDTENAVYKAFVELDGLYREPLPKLCHIQGKNWEEDQESAVSKGCEV